MNTWSFTKESFHYCNERMKMYEKLRAIGINPNWEYPSTWSPFVWDEYNKTLKRIEELCAS